MRRPSSRWQPSPSCFRHRARLVPPEGPLAPVFGPTRLTRLYTVDSLLPGDLARSRAALRHLAIPAVTLGLVIGSVLIRLVRVNMLQALRSDHVDAARARGLPERSVVLRHALRSALVPVVAVIGLQFALLLSGAVLTERTSPGPGSGYPLYRFLGDRDYTAVQGLVTFSPCSSWPSAC